MPRAHGVLVAALALSASAAPVQLGEGAQVAPLEASPEDAATPQPLPEGYAQLAALLAWIRERELTPGGLAFGAPALLADQHGSGELARGLVERAAFFDGLDALPVELWERTGAALEAPPAPVVAELRLALTEPRLELALAREAAGSRPVPDGLRSALESTQRLRGKRIAAALEGR